MAGGLGDGAAGSAATGLAVAVVTFVLTRRLMTVYLEALRAEIWRRGDSESVTTGEVMMVAGRASLRALARRLRPTAGTARGERREEALIKFAGFLLPRSERDRYVTEWLDHLQSASAVGQKTSPIVRSILRRSLPRLVLELWTARLRRAVVRG